MGASPSGSSAATSLPGFMSHLIASATLSIPGMILGETALSLVFPASERRRVGASGVIEARECRCSSRHLYPWLLFPMIPVILVILAFNFL